MPVTHAINNIYKLISFFNKYLLLSMKITKRPRLLTVIHSKFSSGMHGYELVLQVRYHVIVISPPGGASGNFS